MEYKHPNHRAAIDLIRQRQLIMSDFQVFVRDCLTPAFAKTLLAIQEFDRALIELVITKVGQRFPRCVIRAARRGKLRDRNKLLKAFRKTIEE